MFEDKYTYLLVNISCLFFPLIFSFHSKIKFYKIWRIYLPYNILITTFFCIWDILFTYLNVWGFSKNYILNLFIFNLPLEEVMFFIFIPYACSFTHFCNINLSKIKIPQSLSNYITILLIFILIIIGLLNFKKLYTSSASLLLAFFLTIILIKNSKFLSKFYITYILILIPFFVSNGFLTGGFLNKIVVYYNDFHNLGIRIYTIPLEDFIYCMLLIGLNSFVVELK